MRAWTIGTDVEQVEEGKGALGFSGGKQKLVSDRRGSLTDKWTRSGHEEPQVLHNFPRSSIHSLQWKLAS